VESGERGGTIVLPSPVVRGPLLSGPLGTVAVLDRLLTHLRGRGPTVVIGPLWLGETLAEELPVMLLFEPEDRARARRIVRRATTGKVRLGAVMAGVELPLGRGTAGALVIESASALEESAAADWMSALVPALQPDGLLIAVDVTDDPAVEARLGGLFLASALTHVAQDRPRDGVVLTIGRAPSAAMVRARFGPGE
jgi:hypothetical protein